MKYLVSGTTAANEREVIASLEALWDAAYEQEQDFVLLFKQYHLDNPDSFIAKTIWPWVEKMECLNEVIPEGMVTPDFDIALLLVGEEPDEMTTGEATYWFDNGVEVRDLAGQMTRIEFDTEHVPEEPPTIDEAPAQVSGGLDGGWPGEAPEVAPEAPAAEKSREVPAAPPEPAESAQDVDPREILKGVTEADLDKMPVPALKALVDKLGVEADKRSKSQMINGIVELLIQIDKEDFQASGMYDQEADEFVAAKEAELVEDIQAAASEHIFPVVDLTKDEPVILAGNPLDEHWDGPGSSGLEIACGPYGPSLGQPPTDPWASPPTAVVMEVIYLDGTSKKKVFPAPFDVGLDNIVRSV